jgi:phosphoacetylglucosamine mutase
VTCGKTGVKNLHHLAAAYDIGVYFEANGHGTVLFHPRALAACRDFIAAPGGTPEAREAAQRLLLLASLVNQSVGDALSDLLMVEVCLAERGWSLRDWARLYRDLPSRMLQVTVPDRTQVLTTNAERTCTAPVGLQAAVDALVNARNAGKGRRAFVRPSGTEDVVRVYAEAETQALADELAAEVSKVVQKFCAIPVTRL